MPGKRAGLEGKRSGLFMEAIRIIKEMRRATNGKYPRFAIFENVTGAFSSNRGEDFRVVLEEFVKIVEPSATMPAMPGGKWPYADCYVGTGWSIAYRTFDTQYWPRTPQRRRRLYLVADFRGEGACKILFEREGLRGYFAQGEEPWQGASAHAGRSALTDDNAGEMHLQRSERQESDDKHAAMNQFLFESHAQDARYEGPLDVCPIISAKYGTGGLNQPFIVKKDEDSYVAGFKAGQGAKSRGIGWEEECSPTLTAGNSGTNRTPAVCIRREENAKDDAPMIIEHMAFAQNTRNEVRDLKGRSGALAANQGMKQQTYIIEKLVLDDQGGQQISVRTDGKAPTIRAEMHGNVPCVVQPAMNSSNLKPGGGISDE